MSKYLDHKPSKEEEFRQWARDEIMQLNNCLLAVMRAAKIDAAKLAEILFEDIPNEIYSKNLSLQISVVKQKLQEKAKADSLKKLTPQPEEEKKK